MRTKRLDDSEGRRTFVLVFDTGDEVATELLSFATEHRLRGASFTGLGALRDVTLGYWEWDRKEYREIPLREQVEVLSLVGNVAVAPDGGVKVHAHLVVGRRDGTAHGGHLLQAHVRPTLEVVLVESPEHLQRQTDPGTGLALLRP